MLAPRRTRRYFVPRRLTTLRGCPYYTCIHNTLLARGIVRAQGRGREEIKEGERPERENKERQEAGSCVGIMLNNGRGGGGSGGVRGPCRQRRRRGRRRGRGGSGCRRGGWGTCRPTCGTP